MNEQLLKTSGSDVLWSRRNAEKPPCTFEGYLSKTWMVHHLSNDRTPKISALCYIWQRLDPTLNRELFLTLKKAQSKTSYLSMQWEGAWCNFVLNGASFCQWLLPDDYYYICRCLFYLHFCQIHNLECRSHSWILKFLQDKGIIINVEKKYFIKIFIKR